MIYFTSDTHYHHKNIVRGTSDWEISRSAVGEEKPAGQRTRDFKTLEEHDEALVNAINSLVKADDILYHLGDWSFGGFERIQEFRDKLNVKTIHLIYGNHDHHIENNKGGVQKLFSSVQYYSEISVHGQKIIMCHYGMRVWNKSHHGSWMLYGHSHGTLDQMTPEIANPTWIGDQYWIKNWRTMDVGVDTNNYLLPYSFGALQKIMNNRPVLLGVDHHAENTN